MKSKYSTAEIKVVFHRGLENDGFTSESEVKRLKSVCLELAKINIEYVDISYSHIGMDIYNECDMHIGYRVHAHIFNLSQRRRTILIEEDGRGAGVNQTLGLKEIKAYPTFKMIKNKYLKKIWSEAFPSRYISKYVIKEIDHYLNELENINYIQFEWAFTRMKFYYSEMRKHLKQINRIKGKEEKI